MKKNQNQNRGPRDYNNNKYGDNRRPARDGMGSEFGKQNNDRGDRRYNDHRGGDDQEGGFIKRRERDEMVKGKALYELTL